MKFRLSLHKVKLNTITVMSKRYVLEVEVDEHGECFITLPDEMLEETGWDVGTELDWSEEIDGSIILKEILE